MWLKDIFSPWIAALLLQAVLTGILLVKRTWKKFPFFVAYCLANLVLGLACYAAHGWFPRFYFTIYWVKEALGVLLGLAVVYEIFRHLFRPYPALRRLATQIFHVAVVLLVLLGCIVAYQQHSGETYPLMAACLAMEQVTRIIEVGLLGFLFLFASAFGLHWRQYVFGMALGLGVFAAVELVAVTMRLQFGFTANSMFNVVRTISFNSSLFIWIGYLLAPELAVSPAEVPKRAQLEQWNKAVMELIYQ